MLHRAELEITANAVSFEIIDSCSHDDVVRCGETPLNDYDSSHASTSN